MSKIKQVELDAKINEKFAVQEAKKLILSAEKEVQDLRDKKINQIKKEINDSLEFAKKQSLNYEKKLDSSTLDEIKEIELIVKKKRDFVIKKIFNCLVDNY
ncbi:MAG: hypothetical protein LBF33_03080 [Oscillospiraceae bacterium]|nr:hypothetical protein [Oscillospiraceae bacterium]